MDDVRRTRPGWTRRSFLQTVGAAPTLSLVLEGQARAQAADPPVPSDKFSPIDLRRLFNASSHDLGSRDEFRRLGGDCAEDGFLRTPSGRQALRGLPFRLGPESYLEHVRKVKGAVAVPVIASLNGTTLGGWLNHAKLLEEAGADALELNVYQLATDARESGQDIEETTVEMLRTLKSNLRIPVALKLSPFYTSLAHFAHRLDEAGADGLVLFNRFYQPDIDLLLLEVRPNVLLSTPQAMRLPLRWIAILHGRIKASLAATSGIHTHEDVLKMILAGADVTMMCSALLRNGIDHLRDVLSGMTRYMEENEYESVEQMKGSMSQRSSADPASFERLSYMKALTGYHL